MMPGRLISLLLIAFALGACGRAPVHTDVSRGRLEGYIANEVEYYLGVPYARPPVGALRWRPPAPAEGWEGTSPGGRRAR